MKPYSGEGFSGEKKFASLINSNKKKEHSESEDAEGSFIIRSTSESESVYGEISQRTSLDKSPEREPAVKEKASKSGKTVDTKKSKGKSSKSSAKHSPMSEPKMKRDESNPTLRPADEERASTLAAPTTLPVHKNLALPANKPKLGAISSPAGLGYTGDKGSVPLADILLNAFEKEKQTVANKGAVPAFESIIQNLSLLNQMDPNISNGVVEALLQLIATNPNVTANYHVTPKGSSNAEALTYVLLEKWQKRISALEKKEDFDYVDTLET